MYVYIYIYTCILLLLLLLHIFGSRKVAGWGALAPLGDPVINGFTFNLLSIEFELISIY